MRTHTAALIAMSTFDVRVGSRNGVRRTPYAPAAGYGQPSWTQEGHWKPTAAWFMQSGQIGRPQRWQRMCVSRSGCR